MPWASRLVCWTAAAGGPPGSGITWRVNVPVPPGALTQRKCQPILQGPPAVKTGRSDGPCPGVFSMRTVGGPAAAPGAVVVVVAAGPAVGDAVVVVVVAVAVAVDGAGDATPPRATMGRGAASDDGFWPL